MKSITLMLAYPPSDNVRYAGRGKTLSPVVRAYHRYVESLVLEKRVPKITCDVIATVILHPENNLRDSMNCMKVLLDTLERNGVLKNDKQVKDVHIYRGSNHPSDMIAVRFTAWDGPVPDDPEEVALRPSTLITTSDLASVKAKVPAFDKTPFRRRK